LLKDTAVKENFHVQFRAEAFNIFNRTNLGGPSAGLFSAKLPNPTVSNTPTAGQITTVVVPGREIQLSLKLVL